MRFNFFSEVFFSKLSVFVNIKQDLLFCSSEYIENIAFKPVFIREDLRVHGLGSVCALVVGLLSCSVKHLVPNPHTWN